MTIRALPRTFTEGMSAEFVLESGGESFAFPGVLEADHAFTAEFTVPLSVGPNQLLLSNLRDSRPSRKKLLT